MTPLPDASVAAILDYAKAKTEDGSLVAILEGFRVSADPEHRKWWAQVVASYGVGLPGKRPDQPATDFAALISDARKRAHERIEERWKELETARSLAPAPEPLNSERPGGAAEAPANPEPPPDPIAPPEPARPQGWPKITARLQVVRTEIK